MGSRAKGKAKATQAAEGTGAHFPVVGLGASAGGLAAFEAFFSAMPADREPGMAFVLVQHLAPDHKSILTELVQRYTRMRVLEVENGIVVQPNCTYIIPPNRDMAFLNGALQLLEPCAQRGHRLPIDFFFRSLAQDQRERAIGIVLSGTGSDGTLGIRAIKGEGGMVMAQNPESTPYAGMPQSAIGTGLVDFVLPPAEMPAQLVAYAGHFVGARAARPAQSEAPGAEDALTKICVLVRSQTGHDFSRYKKNTVLRRAERRIALHQIRDVSAYVTFLRTSPAEVEALFHDLLIGVTSFFRDPEAFGTLRKDAMASLLAGRRDGAVLRVWTPACSTGEEAYSIAMLFQEAVEACGASLRLQVFATDIDERAVAVARAGIYPASIAADVSTERLARFFEHEPEPDVYHVHKRIRDMMTFSEQDVIRDPPFSRIDLISCRNLLIYMGAELQQKLIPLFHYALNPGGVLFLGASETVGEFPDLFAVLDRKAKIYRRREHEPGGMTRAVPAFGASGPPPVPAPRLAREAADTGMPLRELTEWTLLEQVAPAAALVNVHGDILYLHGRTGQYLEPAPGASSLNILRMARDGLRQCLPAVLHRAVQHAETVRRPGLCIKTNGDYTTVNLTVRPVAGVPGGAAAGAVEGGRPRPPERGRDAPADVSVATSLFLVIFDEAPVEERVPPSDPAGPDAGVAALQAELRAKEEYLQSVNEELQSSNEELRSSNEEMQSVNGELQSTNEELETSKEELQSVNEELATVNAELQTKVVDLSRVGNDMNNLLAGTGIGTVFVDHALCIRRFTPTAARVINLIPSDVGRPIAHIVSNLAGYDRLVPDIEAVLDTLAPRDIEVRTHAQEWYLLRIRPYRTLENVIEGAVLTFTEITELHNAKEAARAAEECRRLAVVVRDAHDAITVQSLDGRFLAWNPAAVRMYGWTEDEALAMTSVAVVPESLREASLVRLKDLARAQVLAPYGTQRLTKDGRTVDVCVTATALVNEAGAVYAIATTERGAFERGTGNAESGEVGRD